MSYGLIVNNNDNFLQIGENFSCFEEILRDTMPRENPYVLMPAQHEIITAVKIPITTTSNAYSTSSIYYPQQGGWLTNTNLWTSGTNRISSPPINSINIVYYRRSSQIGVSNPQQYGLRVFDEGGQKIYSSENRYVTVVQSLKTTLANIRSSGGVVLNVRPPKPNHDYYISSFPTNYMTRLANAPPNNRRVWHNIMITRTSETSFLIRENPVSNVFTETHPAVSAPTWIDIPFFILEVPN